MSWRLIITLAACCNCGLLYPQNTSITHFSFNNNTYSISIFKVDSSFLGNVKIIDNNSTLSPGDIISNLGLNSSSFLITAGVVNSDCSPLGLFISDDSVLFPLNLNDGNGNFYLKPNGVIAFSNAGVNISNSELFKQKGHYNYAIQSGPMLVSGGSINTVFSVNSKNRNLRCGAGVFQDKSDMYVVFAASEVPVTFYEFAQLFKLRFGCLNALNLESGDSAMFFLGDMSSSNKKIPKICRYIVISR